jgi:hypothetical protein
MSRFMRLTLVVAILGLGISKWGEWEFSSPLRWNPLDEKAIPKARSAETFDFQSASGVFTIEVELPMSEQEKSATGGLAMDSSVPCSLVFDTYDGNNRIGNLTVNTLRQDGLIGYSHRDTFEAGTVSIPKRGRYSIRVQDLGEGSNMASGTFSLIRDENSENAAVLSGVLNLFIWAFAGIIVLIGIRLVIDRWRTGRSVRSNT